jgi:hypothetical protein
MYTLNGFDPLASLALVDTFAVLATLASLALLTPVLPSLQFAMAELPPDMMAKAMAQLAAKDARPVRSEEESVDKEEDESMEVRNTR